MTTEELIAQLTELEGKALPGPWEIVYGENGHLLVCTSGDESLFYIADVWPYEKVPARANADLIVALRNVALPALKALAAENTELRLRIRDDAEAIPHDYA